MVVTRLGSLVVERPLRVREVVGSIPGWVIPKNLKMVPVDPRMFGAQQLTDSGLFSHTLIAMDSIRNEVSRVINLSQRAFFTIDQK